MQEKYVLRHTNNMNPGMNPGMKPGMKPGMNPGMNPRMNPGKALQENFGRGLPRQIGLFNNALGPVFNIQNRTAVIVIAVVVGVLIVGGIVAGVVVHVRRSQDTSNEASQDQEAT